MIRRNFTAWLALAALALPASAMDLPAARATLEKLLETYATPRGVRYTAWRGNGEDLKSISAVVASCRGVDAKDYTPEQRKALYIDLYNAKILEMVLQGNPKRSLRDLSRGIGDSEIYSRKTIYLGNKWYSANEIEKILRQEFKDPRVAFALNRGTRSCPPLLGRVYAPETLEEQLEESTKNFLASPGVLVVEREGGKTTITASRLFEWYADDFKAGGGPLAFIAKYGPPEAAEAASAKGTKLAYAEFDWSLNSAH